MEVVIEKVRDVKTPLISTDGSAGIDFYIPEDFEEDIIRPGQDMNIPSGIKMVLPKGKVLIAFNKSGISTKQKLQVGACVVDEDYRGEIHLHVFNYSNQTFIIRPGQKLVQFILMDYHKPKFVFGKVNNDTKRGNGGFGSTGII
jgi:dUTP pyrophosphatase